MSRADALAKIAALYWELAEAGEWEMAFSILDCWQQQYHNVFGVKIFWMPATPLNE